MHLTRPCTIVTVLRLFVLSLFGITLLLAGCGRGSPGALGPGTPANPGDPSRSEPRCVVLSPALGIILTDLGRGSRIVGRHGADLILPDSLPICGDQQGLDYEALIRVAPTHILLERSAAGLSPRLSSLANQHGWTIRQYPLLTLDDIRRSTEDLASLTGADASGLLKRMDEAWSPPEKGLDEAGRVLLLASVSPPSAIGPGSWHHDLLVRLGATPAITRGRPYMVLDAESLTRLAPDTIVLLSPRPVGSPQDPARAAQDRARLIAALSGYDLPAVRRGRVFILDDPLALTPSTAMIGVAEQLAAMLGPAGRY
jgi:ABC-type Fe3+-hydroxamate transport system substrate-binding protein